MQKRLAYIDNLRILLTALVIMHHSAIAYGGPGGWYYYSPAADHGTLATLLTFFLSINQAFFMSLFFFLAAFFTPAALDRKGTSGFLKDRLLRLGIPLIIYIFVLNPTLVFIIEHFGRHNSATYFQVWMYMVTKEPGPGPLWFVLTLLIFSMLYVWMHKYFSLRFFPNLKQALPGNWSIFVFIVFSGAMAFLVRLFYPVGKNFFGLQFGYFVLYIAFFALGIIAYRQKWLDTLNRSRALFWGIIMLVAILCMPIVILAFPQIGEFSGGINAAAAFYAMCEPFICVGMSLLLLYVFQKHVNNSNALQKSLAADVYTVYIIHPFTVVGFTLLIDWLLPVAPAIRFVLLCILSVSSAFILAEGIRRLPGCRRIL